MHLPLSRFTLNEYNYFISFANSLPSITSSPAKYMWCIEVIFKILLRQMNAQSWCISSCVDGLYVLFQSQGRMERCFQTWKEKHVMLLFFILNMKPTMAFLNDSPSSWLIYLFYFFEATWRGLSLPFSIGWSLDFQSKVGMKCKLSHP